MLLLPKNMNVGGLHRTAYLQFAHVCVSIGAFLQSRSQGHNSPRESFTKRVFDLMSVREGRALQLLLHHEMTQESNGVITPGHGSR